MSSCILTQSVIRSLVVVILHSYSVWYYVTGFCHPVFLLSLLLGHRLLMLFCILTQTVISSHPVPTETVIRSHIVGILHPYSAIIRSLVVVILNS